MDPTLVLAIHEWLTILLLREECIVPTDSYERRYRDAKSEMSNFYVRSCKKQGVALRIGSTFAVKSISRRSILALTLK